MNSNYVGPLGPAGYQGLGVGNNNTTFAQATVGGKPGVGFVGPDRSQGETPGVGSVYAAALNERPNLSNPRNMGPTRSPSASAMAQIPVVGSNIRSTGRIRLSGGRKTKPRQNAVTKIEEFKNVYHRAASGHPCAS